MLDTQTKRRIDSARDILVGKVPDPKSQVEMITIAMIYKFMDDMDNQAVEYGGNRSFFTGDYEKFAWTKLFDLKLSGQETLNLYADAISSFAYNPNLPQLFRDIFKNAYLPFRDPQTLKLFLKTINEFHYDHSEKLGDAFEYLLSVLGSQGDAGQFRTPRHIIDFMVDILNPQKGETIADPACGTAGFLISSFKHILKQNTKKTNGDLLTPDERTRLMKQFTGYDISPDMVRLSLVNMYLHGFPNPNIQEYDTLTSEEKWDEYFDIILANPPFMTPKGGIRPHNRFTVQANKAEVLFTDYIAEHINPVSGRAAIVVPNGIVATTNKAYKELRKLLVNESLLAVISLPAGVFQPYSGVKTSILVLDKRLAKKTDKILFVKINNDGFDLGAQRRPIDKNDLPEALEIINNFSASVSNEIDFIIEEKQYILVPKELIQKEKHCLLLEDRYAEKIELKTDFPKITIENAVVKVKYSNKILKSDFKENGKFPIIDQSTNFIAGFWNNEDDVFRIEKPIVVFGDHTKVLKYVDFDFVLGADGVKILQPIDEIDSKYFYFSLQNLEIKDLGYSRHFKELKDLQIPLPPLEIQKEIVAEIEGYQKIIDGAKQVVENYKPTIKINPDWEMVELGEVAKLVGGGTPSKQNKKFWNNGTINWLTCSDFSPNLDIITDSISKINPIAIKESSTNLIPKETIILVTRVSLGKIAMISKEMAINQDLTAIVIESIDFDKKFVFQYLKTLSEYIISNGSGATVKGVTRDFVREIEIPNISLTEQQAIVSQIEEEQKLVDANKKLIAIFEQKIKDRIDEVWGMGKN